MLGAGRLWPLADSSQATWGLELGWSRQGGTDRKEQGIQQQGTL